MRAAPLLLAALLLCASVADAQRVPSLSSMVLRPTLGGVVIETIITPRGGSDVLRGVWSAGARSKLLDCTSRCRVVQNINLKGPMRLDGQSRYRIVLGGTFNQVRKVGVLLSFASGVAAAEAMVQP